MRRASSRGRTLAVLWSVVLAFAASVVLTRLHLALEHHHEGPIAHAHAISDDDDDHGDDHHDDAPHEARDHDVAGRPASASALARQPLAPLPSITVRDVEAPPERPRGASADESPLRIPDPLALSRRKPRAPPLG